MDFGQRGVDRWQEEFQTLKERVKASGKRKDAFLLYERGEQFLNAEQYAIMKEEYDTLGISAVNLEECTVAQMEEMYVEEAEGMRPEVTAFLLYSKGQEVLDPDTFAKMREAMPGWAWREEMAKLGMNVQRAGTKALESTINVTSGKLENDLLQARCPHGVPSLAQLRGGRILWKQAMVTKYQPTNFGLIYWSSMTIQHGMSSLQLVGRDCEVSQAATKTSVC
eukprot:Skav202320  [mRNA]  locus=scaffold60:308459:311850:+ [translate_table: standard]